MSGFEKFLIFVVAVVIAGAILKYTEPIVRLVGKNDLAEKYLGSGGTYTMWKLLAVIIVIWALVYWIGWKL